MCCLPTNLAWFSLLSPPLCSVLSILTGAVPGGASTVYVPPQQNGTDSSAREDRVPITAAEDSGSWIANPGPTTAAASNGKNLNGTDCVAGKSQPTVSPTAVLRMTDVPATVADPTPYSERGWSSFETQVISLANIYSLAKTVTKSDSSESDSSEGVQRDGQQRVGQQRERYNETAATGSRANNASDAALWIG